MPQKQNDLIRELRRKLISDLGLRYSSFDNTWKYRQVIEVSIPAVNLTHDPAAALQQVTPVFYSVVDQILAQYEKILAGRRAQFQERAQSEMN